MWWKVWGDNEIDCIIVRADTFDEAIRKGRQYDQRFDGGQMFDPRWDIERLKMEPESHPRIGPSIT